MGHIHTPATSVVGAYTVLSLLSSGEVAPDRGLGPACGTGGLIGGYLCTRLHPRLPERCLRLLLGTLTAALGALYVTQALT